MQLKLKFVNLIAKMFKFSKKQFTNLTLMESFLQAKLFKISKFLLEKF